MRRVASELGTRLGRRRKLCLEERDVCTAHEHKVHGPLTYSLPQPAARSTYAGGWDSEASKGGAAAKNAQPRRGLGAQFDAATNASLDRFPAVTHAP